MDADYVGCVFEGLRGAFDECEKVHLLLPAILLSIVTACHAKWPVVTFFDEHRPTTSQSTSQAYLVE